jgi:hypothetical protein
MRVKKKSIGFAIGVRSPPDVPVIFRTTRVGVIRRFNVGIGARVIVLKMGYTGRGDSYLALAFTTHFSLNTDGYCK